MRAPRTSSLLLLACSLVGCAGQRAAAPARAEPAAEPTAGPTAGGERLSLERLVAEPPLGGRAPLGLKLSKTGRVLTYLLPSEEDSEVTDLWALALDEEGAEARALVRTKDLMGALAIRLSEEERMALERKRIRHKGITSYAWCGDDERALLFPLSGELYHVALGEEAPRARKLTGDDDAKLDPRCSPKGTHVAFVKKGELYLVPTAGGPERRLTTGASDVRRFGVAEFIAMEEMGRHDGYWFSPDEGHLAYTEVDESAVSEKVRPFIHADKTEMYRQRYPAAGEANALVKLHVVSLQSGKSVAVNLPAEDGYLARAGFLADGALFVQWQSRDQRRLTLYDARAPAFTLRPLLEENDEAWVELHDDLRLSGERLFWTSETSGVKQLYALPREGGARVALTSGEEPLGAVLGVDQGAGEVLFLGASDRGRQQHVFAVPLGGGPRRQVTQEEGWHEASYASGLLVDRHSRFHAPATTRLLDTRGAVLRVLDEGKSELPRYAAPARRWLTLTADDGTPLNGLLLEPVGRREGERSPLLVYTYGGPTTNVVADRFSRLYPLFMSWTQRGFAVLLVDNRGTSARSRAFSRAFKDRFGELEVKDQIAGVRAVLAEHPWLDETRVGIFGWSYGGYVSLMTLLADDSPFAAAAAVAPVTDWALYDTHYTERYIGTPLLNAAAYERSNVLRRVDKLQGSDKALLLVHGMADDNVLFAHSLALVEALQSRSLPFDFMAYPGAAHGISGRERQLHVFRTVTRFFERELRPRAKHEERGRP
jgi:dipeptidyl-peptidase 4